MLRPLGHEINSRRESTIIFSKKLQILLEIIFIFYWAAKHTPIRPPVRPPAQLVQQVSYSKFNTRSK